MLVLVLFLMACKSEAFLGIGDSHDFSTFKNLQINTNHTTYFKAHDLHQWLPLFVLTFVTDTLGQST